MDFRLNTYFMHLKLLMSILDSPAAARLRHVLIDATSLDDVSRRIIVDREFTGEALHLLRFKKK